MSANFSATYVKQIIEKKGWIDLPSNGLSMFPLIQTGNICRFVTVENKTVRPGDIALFKSSEGKLIAHRVIYILHGIDRVEYVLKGDANLSIDESVSQENLLGILHIIYKENYTISSNHIIYKCWGCVIRNLPILSSIVQVRLRKISRNER